MTEQINFGRSQCSAGSPVTAIALSAGRSKIPLESLCRAFIVLGSVDGIEGTDIDEPAGLGDIRSRAFLSFAGQLAACSVDPREIEIRPWCQPKMFTKAVMKRAYAASGKGGY